MNGRDPCVGGPLSIVTKQDRGIMNNSSVRRAMLVFSNVGGPSNETFSEVFRTKTSNGRRLVDRVGPKS